MLLQMKSKIRLSRPVIITAQLDVLVQSGVQLVWVNLLVILLVFVINIYDSRYLSYTQIALLII